MKKYYLLLIGVVLFFVSSCSGDKAGEAYLSGVPGEISLASNSESASITDNGSKATVRFSSLGGEAFIEVEANQEWTLTPTNCEWLTITNNGAGIQIVADQNTIAKGHQGTITVSVGEGEGSAKAEIEISQLSAGSSSITVSEDMIFLSAGGTVPKTVTITSDTDQWFLDTDCEWLGVERTGSIATFIADPNPDTEERKTTVIIYIINDNGEREETNISVTQESKSEINVNRSSLSFNEEGGAYTITVNSNQISLTHSLESEGDWVVVEPDINGANGTVKISVNPTKDEKSRQAKLVLTAGGDDNITKKEVIISQLGSDKKQMVIGVDFDKSKSKNIILPLFGDVDCVVDWGDGTVERVFAGLPSHEYQDNGKYYVTIEGKVTSLNASQMQLTDTAYRGTIFEYRRWGKTGLTSMENAALSLWKLTYLPDDTEGSFSEVTTFSNAFNGLKIKELPENLLKYATKTKSLVGAFANCKDLQSVPNGFLANCTSVTNIYGIFQYAAFTSIPENILHGMPNLEDASFAFAYTDKLESIPAKLFEKSTNLKVIEFIFNKAALKSIPEKLLANCALLENVLAMFAYTNVEYIPDDLFSYSPLIYDFKSVFSNCKQLKAIPAKLFDKNINGRDFYNVFNNCELIESIPQGLFDNNVNATNFRLLFSGCKSLKTIPAGLFKNCPKVTNYMRIFQNTAIESIPTDTFNGTSTTEATGMFRNCTQLTSVPEGLLDGFTKVPSFNVLFEGCSSLKTLPANLFAKCTSLTNISQIFLKCTALETIPAGLFDNNREIKDISNMFNGCTSLKTIPGTLLQNQTKATNALQLFYGCSSLEEIPEGLFSGLTEVTSFSAAFRNCTALRTIPVSLFDNNTKVINFGNTFNGCTALEGESPYTLVGGVKVHLYERADDTGNFTKPTTTTACFKGATKLTDYNSIPTGWR